MARVFTLIVALWTVVLSAPLCASGMVTHPCEPCAADCSHEAACPQDPCAITVLQSDSTTPLACHGHCDALPVLYASLTPIAHAFSFQEKAWRAAAFVPRNEQPYPMGAFPLLI